MAFSLSIIIPCYNVEEYIPKTLDSLSQLNNAENCEFIFINDGSTDNTLSHIQSFAKNDHRAIVINQSNQGVSAARNAALSIAKKEYILCLDGDDFLHPETLSIIKNCIQKSDALLAPCTIVKNNKSPYILPIGIPEGVYDVGQLYNACKFFPLAPQIIYRTAIIQNHNIKFDSNIKSGEVYTFTVDFLRYATSITVIQNSFYNYVMHANSATHLPKFSADISVLITLKHFIHIDNNWSHSPSFLLTAFKLIMTFTYNKYLKHGILSDAVFEAIEYIFSDINFKELLHKIPTKKIDFKHRLFIRYIKFIPPKFGYIVGICVTKLIKAFKAFHLSSNILRLQ
jgi:glycosyltransferase involved in cell wall biosynthesis